MSGEDQGLPPMVPEDHEMDGISERLQEYNQQIQEQAFLLGYRNGYREGDLVQGLLQWVRDQQAEPDISQERLDALVEVEHWLASNGAFIQDEDETTFPPGLTTYIGAFEAQPFVQVAGERIHIQDLDFTWDPNPPGTSLDEFQGEPRDELGGIQITMKLDLPEGSEEREELKQFLEGLHDGN